MAINERMIILFTIQGESSNEYNFTRIRLNWDGSQYSPFTTYGLFVSIIGTAVMVGGIKKLFKLTDPTVGLIGTFSSAISRLINVSQYIL